MDKLFPVKILFAPNAFKASLTAIDFCRSAEKVCRRFGRRVQAISVPIADGGDGTMAVLRYALRGQEIIISAKDPQGKTIRAPYVFIPDRQTAVIEMARFSGLHLLKESDQNPLCMSTFGTGQAISAAIRKGARKIILGIGGSATVDCGAGMIQALGLKAYTKDNRLIHAPLSGGTIGSIAHIEWQAAKQRLKDIAFEIACDVENPLLGRKGAARIFGPQKGARPQDIPTLEKNLFHFCRILEKASARKLSARKGIGAAGGIAVPLIAIGNARLASGIDLVLDAQKFDEKLKTADLVITGEGRIDEQTLMGKGPMGVVRRARKNKIPVIAVAGSIAPMKDSPFSGVFSIVNGPMSLNDAKKNAAPLLEETLFNIIKMILQNKC